MAKYQALKHIAQDGAVVKPGQEIELKDKKVIARLKEKDAIADIKASKETPQETESDANGDNSDE